PSGAMISYGPRRVPGSWVNTCDGTSKYSGNRAGGRPDCANRSADSVRGGDRKRGLRSELRPRDMTLDHRERAEHDRHRARDREEVRLRAAIEDGRADDRAEHAADAAEGDGRADAGPSNRRRIHVG